MAGKVESTIVVNIKAVVDGQGNVNKFSSSIAGLTGASKVGGLSVKGLADAGDSLTSSFAKAFLGIKAVVSVIDLLRDAADFAFKAIKAGLNFNVEIENARLRLGSLIATISSISRDGKLLTGVEAFKAAEEIATQYFAKIQAASILTGDSVANIVKNFEQVASPASRAKLSLEQTLELVTLTTRAAAALGLQFDRVGLELQGILSGNLTRRSPLTTALFGNVQDAKEQIKHLTQTGQLFDVLKQKLSVFALTGEETASTFAGLLNTIQQISLYLASLSTSSLFNLLKQTLTDVKQSIFTIQDGVIVLTERAQGVVNIIDEILRQLSESAIGFLETIVGYVLRAIDYLRANRAYVLLIVNDVQNILKQLFLIIRDLVSIVGDVDQARTKTGTWHELLQLVSVALGPIRDIMNVIIGSLETVASLIVDGILFPIQGLLEIGYILKPEIFGDAVRGIEKVRNALKELATQGAVRAASGLNLDATGEALNDRINPTPLPEEKTTTTSNLTATPNLDQAPDIAAMKKLAALVKETAKLLLAGKRSALEGQNALVTQDFETTKQATEAATALVDREYKERTLTIEDYYKQKSELEDSAFAQERAHLEAGFELAKREAEDRVKEIKDEFEGVLTSTGTLGGSLNEPNLTPAEQDQLKQQEDIRIRTENNKLTQKQVELDTQLLLIDGKRVKAQTDNNNAKKDALVLLAREITDIQAELLAAQGNNAQAGAVKIGEDLKDRFKDALTASGLSGETLKPIIADINQFATLTTDQIVGILTAAGVKVEDIGTKARALLALFAQLQSNNAFGAQQDSAQRELTDLNLQKEAIQNNLNRGLITEEEARRRILQVEQISKDKLLEIAQVMSQLPNLTREQQQALQQLLNTTGQLAVESHKTRDAIGQIVVGGIGNFVSAVVQGTQSIGDSFRQLVSSILTGIAEMILKMLILKAITAALNFLSPGEGGVGGLGTSLFGGHADGGEIRGPGTGTSDSILARLSNGEWIVPAVRVAQYGRHFFESITSGTFGRLSAFAAGGPVGRVAESGGFGNVNLRNVNLFDPELLSAHLNTAHGERAMLNLVSHNPDKFRRALGL